MKTNAIFNFRNEKSYLSLLKFKLTLLASCLVLSLFANNKPISGVILDAESKEPLAFVNIVVEGQSKGTVSNSEGQFVLDLEGVSANSLVSFSYVGYETLKIKSSELRNSPKVYLKKAHINLAEVQVLSRSLTVKEIIKRVHNNYDKNYPSSARKQRLFFHKYEKAPFKEQNQLVLKKANFVGIDKKTFDDLYKKLPKEFIEYQDALVDLYSDKKESKLIPVKGITLEEGSQQAIFNEFESKLGSFFDDIDKTNANPDVYYKFRTGILSVKMDKSDADESVWKANKNDKLNYTVKTDYVKDEILSLLKDYSNIESKNWEFINKSNKYDYVLDDATILNDEMVYKISFKPKKQGLFEGVMYISTDSFAVLQLDFAFAKGKQSEKFQLLGIGHAINFREGRVIFEKGKSGYYLKYIYARQNEAVSIDRTFSVVKKQKRFFSDKTLNEIKIDAELSFNTQSYREILVLDRDEIDPKQFARAKQPSVMKFKKEFAYTPEIWDNNTVIAPAIELKKYKRK
jgi:hypothetical protein